MSTLVKETIALIADVKTSEEAINVISKKYKKLSKKEAVNVVKDLQDFLDGKMKIKELDHWLKSRGL